MPNIHGPLEFNMWPTVSLDTHPIHEDMLSFRLQSHQSARTKKSKEYIHGLYLFCDRILNSFNLKTIIKAATQSQGSSTVDKVTERCTNRLPYKLDMAYWTVWNMKSRNTRVIYPTYYVDTKSPHSKHEHSQIFEFHFLYTIWSAWRSGLNWPPQLSTLKKQRVYVPRMWHICNGFKAMPIYVTWNYSRVRNKNKLEKQQKNDFLFI